MRRISNNVPFRNHRPITVRSRLAILVVGPVFFASLPGTAVATSIPRSAVSAPSSWTTYGGSFTRDATQITDAPTAPLRVAWRSKAQRGEIYGEPLIVNNRVFVATESDTVEALSASTGKVIWSRSVGTAVPSSNLPCGNIGPTVGITSTMVIDQSTSQLFVSAETLVGTRVRHVLVAMSLSNGATLFRRDLDRPHWTASAQLQRAALGLDNGRVLVGFGGNYGDCGSYHGYLMAVPETGTGHTLVYQVPSAREAAIWAPAGMSIAPNGKIYVATGNGASNSNFDMSNAVVELSSTLKLKGWFAPTSWAADSASDLDLGSTSPVMLPGGHLFSVGKSGVGYLLNASHLGGIGGSIQSVKVCNSQGGVAYAHGYIFLPCPSSGMVALRLKSGHLRLAWHSAAAVGSPTFASGLVWSVDGNDLLGLALSTGRVVDTVPAPATEHFAAPSIAEGLVVVAGETEVVAYRG